MSIAGDSMLQKRAAASMREQALGILRTSASRQRPLRLSFTGKGPR